MSDLVTAINHAVSGLAERRMSDGFKLSPEDKTELDNLSLGAMVAEVVLVAAGFFSVVALASSGAVLGGILAMAACILLAIVFDDIRKLADTLANTSTLTSLRYTYTQITSDNPKENIFVAVANKAETIILNERLIRWIVSEDEEPFLF